MNKRNILKWIIFGFAIAINLFIIANSFVSGDASTAESSAVVSTTAGVINGISPGLVTSENLEHFTGVVRKLFGHFGLFALSGFVSTWSAYLFCRDGKYNYFLYFAGTSTFAGLVLAWFSELVQVFMPGRSGSAADVAIDFIGYFIGVLLVILILFFAKKPIFSKNREQEKWANWDSLFSNIFWRRKRDLNPC